MKHKLHSIKTFLAHKQIESDYVTLAVLIRNTQKPLNEKILKENRLHCFECLDRIIANKTIVGIENSEDHYLRLEIKKDFKNILQLYPTLK